MTYRLVCVLALVAAGAAGCIVDTGPEEPPDSCIVLPRTEVDLAAPAHRYVVDSIEIPTSASRASQLGMNLDRDPVGRPDNALGSVLSTVFGVTDTDISALLGDMIADARILHLVEIRADGLLGATGVGVRVMVGADRDEDPTDNFSGVESFDVVDTRVTPVFASGEIVNGRLLVELGVIPLQIALPHVDEPFLLELTAARIDAMVTEDGVVGRIGGVISEDELEGALLPIIHASLSATVAEDCPDGVCEADSNGQMFLELFDEDDDGVITFEELRDSSVVSSLLAPDVDMRDSDGAFVTRCDGVKESLSVGIGFTAVPAAF